MRSCQVGCTPSFAASEVRQVISVAGLAVSVAAVGAKISVRRYCFAAVLPNSTSSMENLAAPYAGEQLTSPSARQAGFPANKATGPECVRDSWAARSSGNSPKPKLPTVRIPSPVKSRGLSDTMTTK